MKRRGYRAPMGRTASPRGQGHRGGARAASVSHRGLERRRRWRQLDRPEQLVWPGPSRCQRRRDHQLVHRDDGGARLRQPVGTQREHDPAAGRQRGLAGCRHHVADVGSNHALGRHDPGGGHRCPGPGPVCVRRRPKSRGGRTAGHRRRWAVVRHVGGADRRDAGLPRHRGPLRDSSRSSAGSPSTRR